MFTITIDFSKKQLEIHNSGQDGTQWFPELEEKTPDILSILSLSEPAPGALMIDFEENTLSIDGGEPVYNPAIENKQGEILDALNLTTVDMTNITGLYEAFVNGQIPRELVEALAEEESRHNEANPDISAFLRALQMYADD